eukprot:3525837-Amphidinium_carterae.1
MAHAASQVAADDDNDDNNSQQQLLQPPHNYSYIDTTLTRATIHTTMATKTSTGQAQRPVCVLCQHKALAGTTPWSMASTSSAVACATCATTSATRDSLAPTTDIRAFMTTVPQHTATTTYTDGLSVVPDWTTHPICSLYTTSHRADFDNSHRHTDTATSSSSSHVSTSPCSNLPHIVEFDTD